LINIFHELTPRPPLYFVKRGLWCIKILLTTKGTKGYTKDTKGGRGEKEKRRKGEKEKGEG
jgi:hypothetical protein